MENLKRITEKYINPALQILPKKMDSKAARIMLLTIGLQESRLINFRYITNPPF